MRTRELLGVMNAVAVPARVSDISGVMIPVMYSTVQNSTVQYSTVQYSTVQYSTVQDSTEDI